MDGRRLTISLRATPGKPYRDHHSQIGQHRRTSRPRGEAGRGAGHESPSEPRHVSHDHRRDWRRIEVSARAVSGAAGRGGSDSRAAPLQAGQHRRASAAQRGGRGRCENRRRQPGHDRRTLFGGESRADGRHCRGGASGRREYLARRSLQAAHESLCLSGHGGGRAEDPARGGRQARAADRYRSDGPAPRRGCRSLHRHDSNRRRATCRTSCC